MPFSQIFYFIFVGGAKMKLCTKFEGSGFIGLWDIVEGMPNFVGVTWPKPRPLSGIGYYILVARDKAKMYTKFEDIRLSSKGL